MWPSGSKSYDAADPGVTDFPRLNRLLIVDDAASNRKMLGRLLERRGFSCDYAVDGVDCLDRIAGREHEYDVILMDNTMPKVRLLIVL